MKKIMLFILMLSLNSQTHEKKRLIEYGYNIYSQFGEDGIIKKIFEVIGTQSKVAVEFGAWDGFHLSNTAALWAKDGSWKGILIEGDKERFGTLTRNVAPYHCTALCAYVGIQAHDCLEAILKKNTIPLAVDLLSVDIDGNDYHIFDSLQELRPRLIVIEYNPTIPAEYDVYAPYSPDNNFGQSVGALNRIAAKKGYKLIALTLTNAFYVLEKDFAKFAEFETDLRLINVNDGYITLVTTYDGKYALIKNKRNCYFYGIEDQFQGALSGDCVRCDTKPLSLIAGPTAAYKK